MTAELLGEDAHAAVTAYTCIRGIGGELEEEGLERRKSLKNAA